ncbi:MAG: phosphohistidine phosphatase SixA [Ignavibacteriales bacterium]|nr:phosphohistidine phosphatase SixA [Ignavibacteriales bacterium]
MKLILVRHGDAKPGIDDASRELSDLGIEQAVRAAQTLLGLQLIPDVIISSPLCRAIQTAVEVGKFFPGIDLITSEHLTPSSDHRHIFEILRSLQHKTVLLVGHEPHLSTLISLLITGTRYGKFIVSKGGIAVIHLEDSVSAGNGALRLVLQSDEIKNIQN